MLRTRSDRVALLAALLVTVIAVGSWTMNPLGAQEEPNLSADEHILALHNGAFADVPSCAKLTHNLLGGEMVTHELTKDSDVPLSARDTIERDGTRISDLRIHAVDDHQVLLVTDEDFNRDGIYEDGKRLREFARAVTLLRIAAEPHGEIEWMVLDSAVLVEGECVVS